MTGSGHFLTEALELAFRQPEVDFFLSEAAEDVLPLDDYRIDALKERFRVFRDNSASSVPVGMLYDDVYHTVIVAPATRLTSATQQCWTCTALPAGCQPLSIHRMR